MIRVAVAGAGGRMGSEAVKAVNAEPDMSVACEIRRGDDIAAALARSRPDVFVELTVPGAAMDNLRVALDQKIPCVVGTTGFTEENLAELSMLAERSGVCCFIAPNFAIGAVLLMRFAAEAATHLPDVEIIELHHERKVDAPSGTAVRTAQAIAAARTASPRPAPGGAFESHAGARGGRVEEIPVHSVRLPGFVASQEVIFGGVGQRLTLRHDSMDRLSFMPGIVLAVRRVRAERGLVVGLEKFL